MRVPKTIEEVEQMTRLELCRLWRFAHVSEFWQRDNPVANAAKERLDTLGGFSPEISKQIGWDR